MTPLLLRAYMMGTALCPFLLRRVARNAHRAQGSSPERWPERLGQATQARPVGRLVWFHAASVGELVSVLELASDLAQTLRTAPDSTGCDAVTLLFTTTTQTAADTAQRRMPEGAIHQFLPIDSPTAVQRFLDHWRPDLACFVESDLWPRLLARTAARRVPMALINARPSKSRQRFASVSRALLAPFALITAQTPAVARELALLGVASDRILDIGDLKSATPPLPVDPIARQKVTAEIGQRPVWVAASTHKGEETAILAAHRHAMQACRDLLLILIPRHPERGDEVADLITAEGWQYARRSQNQIPDIGTPVYLADTLGETGLFYDLAPLVFLGGSFVAKGGHNPYEPAQKHAAILSGPDIKNFAGAYQRLEQAGAAQLVSDASALGATLANLIGSDELSRRQQAAAQLMQNNQQIRHDICAHLSALLGGARLASQDQRA